MLVSTSWEKPFCHLIKLVISEAPAKESLRLEAYPPLVSHYSRGYILIFFIRDSGVTLVPHARIMATTSKYLS